MLLPPEYAWIGLVAMGTVFVFIADLIGNTLNFRNRFMNALITTIVFAALFAFFIHIRYGGVMLTSWGYAVMNPTP